MNVNYAKFQNKFDSRTISRNYLNDTFQQRGLGAWVQLTFSLLRYRKETISTFLLFKRSTETNKEMKGKIHIKKSIVQKYDLFTLSRADKVYEIYKI